MSVVIMYHFVFYRSTEKSGEAFGRYWHHSKGNTLKLKLDTWKLKFFMIWLCFSWTLRFLRCYPSHSCMSVPTYLSEYCRNTRHLGREKYSVLMLTTTSTVTLLHWSVTPRPIGNMMNSNENFQGKWLSFIGRGEMITETTMDLSSVTLPFWKMG